MRWTRFVALMPLFLLSGCSSGSNAGTPEADAGSASKGGDTPGSACDLYLQCVAAATPDQLPIALQAYGPNGTCWGGSATLDADCEGACKASMGTTPHGADFAICGPQNGTGEGPSTGGSSSGTGTGGGSTGTGSGGAGSGTGTGTGAGTGPSESCSECASKVCATPLNDCSVSGACTNIYACIGTCAAGDTTCDNACVPGTMTAADHDNYANLNTCLVTKCGGTCDPL